MPDALIATPDAPARPPVAGPVTLAFTRPDAPGMEAGVQRYSWLSSSMLSGILHQVPSGILSILRTAPRSVDSP